MALNTTKLGDDLLAVMTNAHDQSWAPRQVADGLAAAIDGYVRAATVRGVQVTLPGGQTASQAAAVRLS